MEAPRHRTHVTLHADRVDHVSSTDTPGTYPGFDDSYTFDKFKDGFNVEIQSIDDMDMQFDMIGVDAAVANAIRRILISDVPTMAIENALVHDNSSVLPDEILCHRIGLVPINADPRMFNFKEDDNNELNDRNTLVFKLQMECKKREGAKVGEKDPHTKYVNHLVMSKDMQWTPEGNQATRFKDKPVAPVHDDIVLVELRPGQRVEMLLHCYKGIGKVHAKWSPVATASYRLMPDIVLKKRFTGEQAHRLQQSFTDDVIEVRKGDDGEEEAVVADSRLDMMSREVLRHPDLAPHVDLGRKRDHFLFSVESTGALPPDVLVCEAVQVLRDKCSRLLEVLEAQTGQQ